MESADYDIGEAHGPLVTEAATVHILCCAALEAHVNSVARSALSGHDYEVFEKWPPQTKWEYLPRLCGWGTFEIGGSPFQDFAVLVHYRNALLHYKKRSEPSVQGKEPAFIKDIGLTVAQAEQSIYAAESMISELARMRGVKAPYWLRRDLNEMSYWNVFLVLPRKCQRNRKLRPSGQRAPHSRTPPPKRKRHS
jgi:hypothetical protein